MEHPKDIGDKTTLAVMLALRARGLGVLKGEVDNFAVYCPETSGVYLIPMSDLPIRVRGHLRVDPPRNNQRKFIRFAEQYKIGRVHLHAPD